MSSYYKFIVHLGDNTYNNIILGDQLIVMSDVKNDLPSIYNITLELDVGSTELGVICTNYNSQSIQIEIADLYIRTSASTWDKESDWEDYGYFIENLQGNYSDTILYFDAGSTIEEVSISFIFKSQNITLGEKNVSYGL